MNKNNRTTFIIGQTDSLEIAESISCLVSDHYWSRSEEVLRRQIAGLAAAGESCAALLCSAVILTHLKLFSHQWTTLQRALLFLLFHYFYFAVSSEIQKTQVHEYKLKQYLLTCSVHFYLIWLCFITFDCFPVLKDTISRWWALSLMALLDQVSSVECRLSEGHKELWSGHSDIDDVTSSLYTLSMKHVCI